MYTDSRGRITVEVRLGATAVGTILRKPRVRPRTRHWTVMVCDRRITLHDPHGAAYVSVNEAPADMCREGY